MVFPKPAMAQAPSQWPPPHPPGRRALKTWPSGGRRKFLCTCELFFSWSVRFRKPCVSVTTAERAGLCIFPCRRKAKNQTGLFILEDQRSELHQERPPDAVAMNAAHLHPGILDVLAVQPGAQLAVAFEETIFV